MSAKQNKAKRITHKDLNYYLYQTMRIRVKSLPGDEYCIDVQNNHQVLELKAIINQKSGGKLPIDRQKLVFKGRTLQDNNLISDYNLEEDCRIHLIKLKADDDTDHQYPTPSSMQVEPSNQQTTASSSSRLTTSEGLDRDNSDVPMQSRHTLKDLPAHDRFTKLLSDRLMNHFQPSVHQRIMARLQAEILADINSSSLDDLERLAEQKLNISEE